MSRLGKALSPEILGQFGNPGAVAVQSVAPFDVYCMTPDSAASSYPRSVVISSAFSGLAGAPIAWQSWVTYSTDAGATWTQITGTNSSHASAGTNEWSATQNDNAMKLDSWTQYRFGIVLGRDDVVVGSTGDFSDSYCQLAATIYNQNGTAPPY